MKDFLFQNIQNRLEAEVQELRHYDWYNEQYGRRGNSASIFGLSSARERETQELPFELPAVFFEFDELNFRSISGQEQLVFVSFRLHMVSENYENWRMGSPSQGDALRHLNVFVSKVYRAMQGYSPQFFAPFQRVEEKLDHRQDNRVINTATYRTSYTDDSATRELVVIPDADISIGIGIGFGG